MFLPVTEKEIKALGWERPDIILVTGDTYIDSPYIGVSIIGQYLTKHGFKVAVIAQPSIKHGDDIKRLGEPSLFWGVTAGCIDSMVANYTPSRKFRRQDDYTPGGINIRPNRATIAYTSLIRCHFKNTKPIVLGGVEASLRRIAHYDSYTNTVRRSILLDSKADIIAYGMAEKTIIELANALKNGLEWKELRGLCYISGQIPKGYESLPSFEKVVTDKKAFMSMSAKFYLLGHDQDRGFVQKHGARYLVNNPSQPTVTTDELDSIYEMEFECDAHPYYKTGKIKALDTIKQSVTAHRGCFGQCNFCAIAIHQGRQIVSRSHKSIIREVERISKKAGFNGIIYDIGGPTANMYGMTCKRNWICQRKHCLMPKICPNLGFGHKSQISLLRHLLKLPGIKKVFIASGIRHDLVVADRDSGFKYVDQLVKYHVSGQIKLAPEHCDDEVLSLMNKPSIDSLMIFREMFQRSCKKYRRKYFMTYYIMAAHPGCTSHKMRQLSGFLKNKLQTTPKQVQIFTPTPSTLSTAMFHCETDVNGRKVFCEKSIGSMTRQKEILRGEERRRRYVFNSKKK